MAQRHNGEFGQEHESRFQEQYGGRARDRQPQGRGDEWRDERRWTGPREGSDYDPDFGRGYEGGGSTADYPRFGDRNFSDRERRDPELGQYAGRGYEPSRDRGSGDRERGRGQRTGGFGGGYEGSYDERSRGHFGGEGRGDPGYESEYGGGYGLGPEYEGRDERGFGSERRPGGSSYGRRFGGSSRSFGDGGRSGYGQGPRDEGFEGSREVGMHSGRGPKGYRRSDERIREEICDRLTADPTVDASDLTVNVKDAEVTLEGTVESRWMKRRAEDAAEDVQGVSQVHNRLQVRAQNDRNRDSGASKGNARAATASQS